MVSCRVSGLGVRYLAALLSPDICDCNGAKATLLGPADCDWPLLRARAPEADVDRTRSLPRCEKAVDRYDVGPI